MRRKGLKRSGNKTCTLPKGSIAVIAEKPRAAEKIAKAIGSPVKCRMYGVPYWLVRVDGRSVVVASTAGHMYAPSTDERGYPTYNYYWAPIWESDRKAGYLKKYYRLLSSLLRQASMYVNACDYDIEGSVIGYMIIKHLGDERRAYRMKYSSLSLSELKKAFSNLQPLDRDMVEAGITRHELDWIWGINISRALTSTAKRLSNKRLILSAGRVQTPTLVEAVNRWRRINLHIPTPTISLQLTLEARGVKFKARTHGWSPETKNEALLISRELRKVGYLRVVESHGKRKTMKPQPAFNLGDLQLEASRLYRYSPSRTQSLAEDLYLDGLISYPRTNSQKLPPTIDYASIIHKIESMNYGELSLLARELRRETQGVYRPVQGRKEDPAHPAIHPTGERPGRMDRDHERIYDLVVRRFMATFSKPAVIEDHVLILTDFKGRFYESRGTLVLSEGWLRYYPYSMPRQSKIPLLREGEKARILDVEVKVEWSKPSINLSKTSLLKWMENVNIGTEGTRARIIEILFKRRYLTQDGGRVDVSDLGYTVTTIIGELFPQLQTPDLTRTFESLIEAVRIGRTSRETVIREAINTIDELLEGFHARLPRVRENIAKALGAKPPSNPCIICGRESATGRPASLCSHHKEALEGLKEALPVIARRLGLSKSEALKRIASMRGQVGLWVKEVAREALRNKTLSKALIGQG
ncbi:MAG: DNA topoisomerase I [Desulfurococcales archaeon]|nr:DNA topoisomerase I [Desulfurococcales archaeon]